MRRTARGIATLAVALSAVLASPTSTRADSGRLAASGAWPTTSALFSGGDSAMSGFFNPAAMAWGDAPELELVVLSGIAENEGSSAVSGLNLRGRTSDSNWGVVPTLFYSQPVGDNFAFGASLVVPAGFGDNYGSNSPTRYFVEEWSLFYVSANLAAAYRITDQLAAGFGVAVNYARFDLESAVLNEPGFGDGRMELEADGVGVSFYGGLSYRPWDSTRIGFVYRSKAEVDLDGNPDFSNLSPGTEDRLDMAGLLDQEIEIGGTLPPTWGLGFVYTLADGSRASFDVAYIQYSDFELADFAFLDGTRVDSGVDYDDIFAFTAGFDYPVSDRFTVGVGAAYMNSPVSVDNRPFSLRTDRTWLVGGGIDYAWGRNKAVSFNMSYADLGNARINRSDVPVLGDITAEYSENYALIFDVRFRYAFY